MRDKVEKAIEKIRPFLQRDGGDIELVDITGNVVKVRLKGACSGCPMSHIRALKEEVPEIEKVEAVD